MKKFITVIIYIVVLLCTLDVIVKICGDVVLTQIPDFDTDLSRDNYRMNRVLSDVVIIGSSTASHHYVTNQLRDSLNSIYGNAVSVHNCGIDGRDLYSSLCAIESIVARYSPKLILLDLHAESFSANNNDILKSSIFYSSNECVRRYLDDLGWDCKLKMKSSLYRYNGRILDIVLSFLFKVDDSTGYAPLKATMIDDKHKDMRKEQLPIKDNIVLHFKQTMDLCKKKNIEVIVVSSPCYGVFHEYEILGKLCSECNVHYLDMNLHNDFQRHQEYFKDEYHLNDNGAHFFTALLYEDLKCYLSDY